MLFFMGISRKRHSGIALQKSFGLSVSILTGDARMRQSTRLRPVSRPMMCASPIISRPNSWRVAYLGLFTKPVMACMNKVFRLSMSICRLAEQVQPEFMNHSLCYGKTLWDAPSHSGSIFILYCKSIFQTTAT